MNGIDYRVSCIQRLVKRYFRRTSHIVGQCFVASWEGRSRKPPILDLWPRMPIRILIAEDSPAVRTALRSLLQSQSAWEIIEAENGQEALAKAQEYKPNLILLDLVMPVMDGLTAARHISQLLPEIPMLMHTMHWSAQVELEAQKVGVRKVISKANTQLLISTMRQFLSPEPAASSPLVVPLTMPAPPILESASLESGSASASDQVETPAADATADVPGKQPS